MELSCAANKMQEKMLASYYVHACICTRSHRTPGAVVDEGCMKPAVCTVDVTGFAFVGAAFEANTAVLAMQ